jgi:Ca2+-binding EF-hand superfamily protein
VLNKEETSHMSFEVFIKKLSSFIPGASIEKKIENTFKAFDEDDGGTISRDEIEKIVILSLNNNPFMSYSKAQIESLIDQLIHQYGRKMASGDFELELDDYRKMVRHAPGILDSFDLNVDDIFQDE